MRWLLKSLLDHFFIIIYQIGEAVNESLSVFTKLLHKNNQNIVLAAKFYSPK
jgi:hypothetical protein